MYENQKSEWVYLGVSTVVWPRDSIMSSSLCCTLPMRLACEWLRRFLQSNQARWFLIYAVSLPRPLGSKRWTSHPAYNIVSKNAASFPSRLWRYRQKIPLIWNSLKHLDEQSNQLLFPCITHDMSRKRATESGANFSFVVLFFSEIIYNKSHPSSLTKQQGALNGWHVLKLTSLVLNVLAVLKKFKQKTLFDQVLPYTYLKN